MAKGRKIGPGKNFTHTSDRETQFKVNQTTSVQGSTGSDFESPRGLGQSERNYGSNIEVYEI